MLGNRGNKVVVLGLALGMIAGVAQTQQMPVLSDSAPTGGAIISAPEPMLASAPQPLNSGGNTLNIVPPIMGKQRVADRQFWTVVSFTAGAALLDGETTIRDLQTPGRHEINPLLGSHPDRSRFYATVGAADVAMAYLAYRLKRSGHEKLWKAPLLGTSFVHLGGAINNLRD